jgi:cellobiose-specific phosphotransferase system component IIC
MQKPSVPVMIAAAVMFIFAIPILINPVGQTPFAITAAVFSAIAGLCLIVGLIIRFTSEKKKDSENNPKGGSGEE